MKEKFDKIKAVLENAGLRPALFLCEEFNPFMPEVEKGYYVRSMYCDGNGEWKLYAITKDNKYKNDIDLFTLSEADVEVLYRMVSHIIENAYYIETKRTSWGGASHAWKEGGIFTKSDAETQAKQIRTQQPPGFGKDFISAQVVKLVKD